MIYKRKHLIWGLLTVSDVESVIFMVGKHGRKQAGSRQAVGRHGARTLSDPQAGSGMVSESSKPTPVTHLPQGSLILPMNLWGPFSIEWRVRV